MLYAFLCLDRCIDPGGRCGCGSVNDMERIKASIRSCYQLQLLDQDQSLTCPHYRRGSMDHFYPG